MRNVHKHFYKMYFKFAQKKTQKFNYQPWVY